MRRQRHPRLRETIDQRLSVGVAATTQARLTADTNAMMKPKTYHTEACDA